MNKLFNLLIASLLFACTTETEIEHFQGNLMISDSLSIPFDLEYNPSTSSYAVINGQERIDDLIHSKIGDSTDLEHPVFNSNLRFIREQDTLRGTWYNREKKNYKMVFVAYKDVERAVHSYPSSDPSGKWAVRFSSEPEHLAVGDFSMTNEVVSGTFLTRTGDYRYLQGAINANRLLLSTFDFSHAFVFVGTLNLSSITGTFYSGHHWVEQWSAVRDEQVQMPSAVSEILIADSLCNFEVQGLSGEYLNKQHPLFEGKPMVVQLFGSWCPNCYDESKYLSVLNKEFESEVFILGVGFERQNSFEQAVAKLNKFKDGLNINYSLAFGGPASKDSAQLRFPFLQEVIAFPTLLFFDRDHNLVAVHSGFNGPGTGKEYLKTKKEIRSLFQQLIEE